MGYGKSTAIRSCFQDRTMPTLWLRVFDSSPHSLWHSFCSLFREMDEHVSSLLAQLPSPTDAVTRRSAIQLLRALPLASDIAVVIDDYHLAACPETNDWLIAFACADLKKLKLILLTRSIRMPALEELRLKGIVAYIGKSAFEFSAEDIARYYRLAGTPIPKSESARLRSWSEGWVSALYLLLLSHREHGNWDTTTSIDRLLESAVFEPLEPAARRLLISLSPFDSFTLPLANRIHGEEGTAALLEELQQRNAFIHRDPVTGTWQVHRLFNGFLRDMLDRDDTIDQHRIHQRAGDWLLENGRMLDAMQHFLEAGDCEGFLTALERDRGASIRSDRRDFLINAMDACPEPTLRRHPVAMLVYAMCLTTYNDTVRCAKLCEALGGYVAEGAYDAEETARLQSELTLFTSFACYNDAPSMVARCREARSWSEKSVRFMDTRGSWTFGAPSVLYMFHHTPGGLSSATAALQDGLSAYQCLTDGHGTGAEHVMEAEMHYHRGDAVEAEIASNRAIYAAEHANQPDIQLAALFLQARLAMTSGNLDRMKERLEQMSQVIDREKSWDLTHTVDLCRGYLYGCLRRQEDIPEWLSDTDGQPSPRLFFQAFGFSSMVTARAMLLRRDPLKLIGVTDQWLALVSVFPSQAAIIHLLICRAAAHEQAFRHERALADLTAALDAALPDSLLMPFVENSDLVAPLLPELMSRGTNHDGMRQLVALMQKVQPKMERIVSLLSSPERPDLTERERQIAEMAAQGLSNREIGARLYITENTVKTILKNVFEKLEIKSRALLSHALRAEG